MGVVEVLEVLDAMESAGVDAVVNGGWAVDALLGEQTRSHADLDLWLPADSFGRAIDALGRLGIDRLISSDDARPWNVVLGEGHGRLVDLHVYELLPAEAFHFGGVLDGVQFPAEALSGEGVIGGRPVRCDAPAWSLRWHSGYPPRAEDRHDMQRLCAAFGLDLPAGLR